METRSWKSITAGILSLVAGAFVLLRILGASVIFIGASHILEFAGRLSIMPPLLNVFGIIGLPIAMALAASGILAIVGGVYVLKGKYWGLALAGSIAAVFAAFPLGIAALILLVLSRSEFK